MHAATVVGYTANASEICMDCIEKYVEAAIDQRIARSDALAEEYGWSKLEHDRDMIRTDIENQELEPIFADSEHDRYPVCDVCFEKIEDVTLTPDGMAYERRLEHEGLEEDEDDHVLTPEQQTYADMQGVRMESRGLKFGIIYSVDLAYDQANAIKCYQPWGYHWPGGGKDGPPHDEIGIWTKTEGDDSYEYDYLEGDWIGGIHRKYVATLDKEQFRAFMDHTNLRFETENTMGSLGGPTPDQPGGDYGVQPAISFDASEGGAIINAYITPFWVGDHTPDDDDWNRIVEMLRSKYS